MQRIVALWHLARWLGPWADAAKVPPNVATRDVAVGDARSRVFWCGRTRATTLVAPGLHYAGADDPRMDRFCRILARAGHLVVVPVIADYLALRPTAHAKREFAAAFDALPAIAAAVGQPVRRPVVFSISFGSLLAFALAAERGEAIERLVIFGGYANLAATLRFALTGARRDPLNQPVVLANLLDRPELEPHWKRFVTSTWGRPELKAREKMVAIAEAIARDVPPDLIDDYLVWVGVRDGAAALMEAALAGYDGSAVDPTPYLGRIRVPVDLVHGADDDVIPFEHSQQLGAQIPDARVHITGLYGHTGTALPSPRALAGELATMARLLTLLA